MNTPASAQVSIGKFALPAQKPYLNTKQRYPVGNGIMMAVGETNGAWTRLIGPGYTITRGKGMVGEHLILSEATTLEIDGVEHALSMDMHRAEKSGVFYGVQTAGELRIVIVDHAPVGLPVVNRLIQIENISSSAHKKVIVKTTIVPSAKGGGWSTFADEGKPAGHCVTADGKSILITFSGIPATPSTGDGKPALTSDILAIEPGASRLISICHYGFKGQIPAPEMMREIRSFDFASLLAEEIRAWQKWFDDVAPAFKLENIENQRARDIVEGGLAIMKINQSQDGGFIAHSTFYSQGYFRDAALGLRGFTAMGHFEESKHWIQWVQSKFEAHRHIPNWAHCAPSLDEVGNMEDLGNQDLESTALFILAARDYFKATGDLKTLAGAGPALRFCMDIQLKHAEANGYKMEFCGDETEICLAIDVKASGLRHSFKAAADNYWSLTSVALCAAALEFYIELLRSKGENPESYVNSTNNSRLNLNDELAKLKDAMDRDYWRTDIPELPEGFHEAFRVKKDNSFALLRIVNFILFPVYFGTPYKYPDREAKDVAAMLHYFNRNTGFLQLVPGADTGFDGHTLGYLLWDLLEVGNPDADRIYQALVNGPTADCWGSFAEAYTREGKPNTHDLRTFETGCNISAIAKYHRIGTASISQRNTA